MSTFRQRGTSRIWRFGWQFLFSWLFLAAVLAAIVATLVSGREDTYPVLVYALWMVAAVFLATSVLAGFLGLLLLMHELHESMEAGNAKLDSAVEMLNRNRNLLSHIARSTSLSDAAKEIAFHESDRMELREAVLAKVHRHQYETAEAILDAMGRRSEYQALADELRSQLDQFRGGTEQARTRQAVRHVEELLEKHRWSAAKAQIENLVQAFPDSPMIAALPQQLSEAKEQRKRELLAAWDNAVKREDVDLSLEILKELDLYLTPQEGLALQESASHVYRAKLHNLGVRFSIAIADKEWQNALLAGRQIMREFPNSRMAHEIRTKMDVLQQRCEDEKKAEL